ncbi:MAG: SOS response-associated peptidase [Alphaproteobacteria bacterium]
MCGRYSITTPVDALQKLFDFADPAPSLAPRYNLAPGQDAPVLRLDSTLPTPRRRLVMLRWGLVPAWAKDARAGDGMINARGETVDERPTFRAAFQKRRCLVLADGFYEWQGAAGRRVPYRIEFEGRRPFAMAGLWESWTGPEGVALETFAIVTTDANRALAPIHHRMPVIVPPWAQPAWLGEEAADAAHLKALLRPYEEDDMIAYQISPRINKAAVDDPSVLERHQDMARLL